MHYLYILFFVQLNLLSPARPDATILAAHDDISIIAPVALQRDIFSFLVPALAGICLSVSPQKCILYSPASIPDSISLPEVSITHHSKGFCLLGIPIGSPEFIRDFLSSKIEEASSIAGLIARIQGKQAALLIFRHCFITRLAFWWRGLPPSISCSFANQFDRISLLCLESLMHVDLGSSSFQAFPGFASPTFSALEVSRWQLSLPCCLGGLGFKFHSPICPLAFFASFSFAISQPSFPSRIKESIVELISSSSALLPNFIADVKSYWSIAVPQLRLSNSLVSPIPKVKGLAIPVSPDIPFAHASPKGLLGQRNLTRLTDIASFQAVFPRLSPTSKAWLLSCSERSSSLPFTILPFCYTTSFDDDLFSMLFCHRLQLPLPQAFKWSPDCPIPNCEHSLDPFGIHFTTCKAGLSARTCRHNVFVDALFAMLSAARTSPVKEATGPFGPNHLKADLWLPLGLPPKRLPATLDVVVADPRGVSYLAGSSIRPLHAARLSEGRKLSKYSFKAAVAGSTFFPVSLEASGAWGPGLSSVFKLICKVAQANSIPVQSFTKFYSVALACAFARAQAKFLLSIATRISLAFVSPVPTCQILKDWEYNVEMNHAS